MSDSVARWGDLYMTRTCSNFSAGAAKGVATISISHPNTTRAGRHDERLRAENDEVLPGAVLTLNDERLLEAFARRRIGFRPPPSPCPEPELWIGEGRRRVLHR